MKTLVIYDSLYGNTEKIAKAIGGILEGEVLPVKKVRTWDLKDTHLLFVGSPTHGGRPTPELEEFVKQLPDNALKGKKVAAFDTRFEPKDHGIGLRILMNVIRFAAERIAHDLKSKGGKLIAKPAGFIVEDKEGPLKKGEMIRAANWAKEVSHHVKN